MQDREEENARRGNPRNVEVGEREKKEENNTHGNRRNGDKEAIE